MYKSVGNCLSLLAMFVMVVPAKAFEANSPLTKPTTLRDVALTADGALVGTIVGKDGMPLANRHIRVIHDRAVVAQVHTDVNGRYEIQDLKNGIHILRSANTEVVCRFWSADSAPPSARSGLMFAEDAAIVRGQEYCDECGEPCAADCGEGSRDRRRAGGLMGGVVGSAGVPLLAIGAFAAVGVAAGAAAANGKNAAVLPASP